jgi:arginase
MPVMTLPPAVLYLLYPEWQGSGKAPAVQQGAITIARTLFPHTTFLTIQSPAAETLQPVEGVIGLQSIAPRFHKAMAQLRAESADRILTVGGTCGVEAAPVGYLNERYGGDLAVVWLDAHGDLNTPESSPSGNFHGMILRTLLGEGPAEYVSDLRRPLSPTQVFLAGTRDLDPPEMEFITERSIAATPPNQFSDPGGLVEKIRSRGFTNVYLHLDLDALNPADFPDTLIPTPGGPGLGEVCAVMQAISSTFEVAGFSIVEYVHGRDESLDALRKLIASGGFAE